MTGQFDDNLTRPGASDGRGADVTPGGALQPDIPALVSDLYDRAPAALRVKLLEDLLRPVGPLAMVAVAAGAFGRFDRRR